MINVLVCMLMFSSDTEFRCLDDKLEKPSKMYGTQDWLCLTLLIALFGCLYVRQGSSKILQFSKESWLNDSWKGKFKISKGDRVRLNCITAENNSSLVNIIKPQNAMDVLPHEVVQVECQAGMCVHDFGSITCNDMGTYVCKDGKNATKEAEVAIMRCEPQLCNGEEKGRIIQTTVNETKNFSLCVVAYPDIEDFALLNSKRIQANRIDDNEQWSWYYEKTSILEFMVHIKITIAIRPRPESYPFTFTIFTYGTQRLHLNYSFELHVLGPPECPTDLQVTNVGADCVTLSWLPGWDGGSEQSFHFNYSIEDSENWTRYSVVFGEVKSVTITGLDESTNYTFRILPSNSFTNGVVDCENTVSAKTLAKTPGSPTTAPGIQVTSPSEDAPSTLALVIIIVIVVIIIAFGVVGVVLFFKITKILARARNVRNPTSANTRRRDPVVEQRTSGADSEQNLLALTSVSNSTNSEDSGHYLSPEGLTYITIDHGTNPGRRTPNRAKRQNERVQYVTLDFEKTRKFAVNHLNEFNGTDNRTEKLYVNAY